MPALASLYPASLTLSMLAPPGGPAEGGTEVRLFGAGLAALAHHHMLGCDFAGITVPARIETNGALQCTTPATPVADVVAVRFTRDAGTSWVSGNLSYRYYDPPRVRGLQPRRGAIAGGDIVLVTGAGFGPYADLDANMALCRFGSHELTPPSGDGILQPTGAALADAPLRTHQPRHVTTPASVLHRGALRCKSPATSAIGAHYVTVSLNGHDFSRDEISFEYYDSWHRPLVGGIAPPTRREHAVARLGRSLWVFGGTGDVRTLSSVRWRSTPRSGRGGTRRDGTLDLGDHEVPNVLRNDMHELRADQVGHFYASLSAPSLAWNEVRYVTLEHATASPGRAAGPMGAEMGAGLLSAGSGSSLGGSNTTFTLTPGEAPRARCGHTLTAVGGRLVLVGGEAETYIEYQLGERFRVRGAQTTTVPLTPRARSTAGDVTMPSAMDPAATMWRGFDAVEGVPPELGSEPADGGELGERWQEDPVWVTEAPKTTFHLDEEMSFSHVAQGDAIRPIRDDLDYVDEAQHLGSDVHVQRREELSDA